VRQDVPVGHPAFGKAIPCEACDAYQRIVFNAVQHLTRVPADLAEMEADWTTFPPEMDAEAIVVMQRYSARICAGDIAGVRGIVLLGHNQVGKSGLAYCVHQDLLAARVPSVFLTEIDLLEMLTEAMFDRERPGRHLDILDRLATVTHLALDDLGEAKPTDKREEFLFTLLDHRGKQPRTVTTITTNLDGPQLKEHLGKRVYARISGHVYSRLLVAGGYCALIGGDPDIPLPTQEEQEASDA
jgi:DNA replication protein DnaC